MSVSSVWLDLSASARPEMSVILFARRLQQQTSAHARRNRSHTHTQRLSQHTTGCTSAWLANPCGAARPLNDTRHPLCGNQQCTDVSLAQRHAVPEAAMRATSYNMMPHTHTQAAHGLNTLDETRHPVWKPTDTIVHVWRWFGCKGNQLPVKMRGRGAEKRVGFLPQCLEPGQFAPLQRSGDG